ncbi:MAG: peroxidase family protein [Pseudomonadota bacterium]
MLFTSGPSAALGGAAADEVERLAGALDGPVGALRTLDGSATGYGYLAPDAPDAPEGPDHPARLDALAAAMAEADGGTAGDETDLPLILPLFTRFLEHDLSAPAWTRGDARLRACQGAPLPRAAMERDLSNLRDGPLRLQSLYECDLAPGPLGAKLTRLMREPHAPARLRLDRGWRAARRGSALPRDRGVDLLRLGRLLGDDPRTDVTEAEIRALPPHLRAALLRDGRPDQSRAVIGESRNDRFVQLSQLHVAMARFHNRVADWLADQPGAAPATLFETAQDLVRRHVQWLVLNAYLPRLCAPRVLARVRRARAPIYTEFRNALSGGSDIGLAPSLRLPVPLEFAVAAFRFPNAMIRPTMELNALHAGRDAAGLNLLAEPPAGGTRPPRLPEDLVVDWSRWAPSPPRAEGRAARRIDTWIAPPGLHDAGPAFAALARAALGRGHALNLPSAQALLTLANAVYDDVARPLSEAELVSGHTGEAVRDGLTEATPLWFYILKEAELQQGGQRLGDLGSLIVAETLVGLMEHDPSSVLHARGRHGGPWTPDLGATPDGALVDDFEGLMRAAELL